MLTRAMAKLEAEMEVTSKGTGHMDKRLERNRRAAPVGTDSWTGGPTRHSSGTAEGIGASPVMSTSADESDGFIPELNDLFGGGGRPTKRKRRRGLDRTEKLEMEIFRGHVAVKRGGSQAPDFNDTSWSLPAYLPPRNGISSVNTKKRRLIIDDDDNNTNDNNGGNTAKKVQMCGFNPTMKPSKWFLTGKEPSSLRERCGDLAALKKYTAALDEVTGTVRKYGGRLPCKYVATQRY